MCHMHYEHNDQDASLDDMVEVNSKGESNPEEFEPQPGEGEVDI